MTASQLLSREVPHGTRRVQAHLVRHASVADGHENHEAVAADDVLQRPVVDRNTSRRDGDQDVTLRPLPVHATRVHPSGAALQRLQAKVSALIRAQPAGHRAGLEQLVARGGGSGVGGQPSVGPPGEVVDDRRGRPNRQAGGAEQRPARGGAESRWIWRRLRRGRQRRSGWRWLRWRHRRRGWHEDQARHVRARL